MSDTPPTDRLQQVIDALIAFRDARDWAQFHDTKNLAIALGIEAAELNELFLWKSVAEAEEANRERLAEELADVLAYAFLLAEKHHFDIPTIMLDKIRKNAAKYPADQAKGSAAKYTDYEDPKS